MGFLIILHILLARQEQHYDLRESQCEVIFVDALYRVLL